MHRKKLFQWLAVQARQGTKSSKGSNLVRLAPRRDACTRLAQFSSPHIYIGDHIILDTRWWSDYCRSTFSRGNLFSRLGNLSQIADWYFCGWRAQTTRKFLFCSITSMTCSKSRSWYFRGLDANRENMVTAGKRRFTVDIHRNWGHPSSSIFKSCMGIGRVKST